MILCWIGALIWIKNSYSIFDWLFIFSREESTKGSRILGSSQALIFNNHPEIAGTSHQAVAGTSHQAVGGWFSSDYHTFILLLLAVSREYADVKKCLQWSWPQIMDVWDSEGGGILGNEVEVSELMVLNHLDLSYVCYLIISKCFTSIRSPQIWHPFNQNPYLNLYGIVYITNKQLCKPLSQSYFNCKKPLSQR